MKYYTRNTHDFNNETREWKYRATFESLLEKSWHTAAKKSKTLGIHALDSGRWSNLREVVDENESYFKQYPEEKPENFSLELVEKELAELEVAGMVKSKES